MLRHQPELMGFGYVGAMKASPLTRVRGLTARLAELSAERDLAVARAVASGASWTELGEALGVSPQAAHKRYRWIRHSDVTGAVWHERPLNF